MTIYAQLRRFQFLLLLPCRMKRHSSTNNHVEDEDRLLEKIESRCKEAISLDLLSQSFCSSLEESLSVADALFFENENLANCLLQQHKQNLNDDQRREVLDGCVQTLQDYIEDISTLQAFELFSKSLNLPNHNNGSTNNEDDDSSKSESTDDDTHDDLEVEDDDGQYIGEGECEICERSNIKLTRHHLIPKTTWPRIKPRLMQASIVIARNDLNEATDILGMGDVSTKELLEEVLPNLFSNRPKTKKLSAKAVTTYLGHHVCKLCRPCHSTLHSIFTEMELAKQYNTVDKLLSDDRLYKFAKWINKQKTGKHFVTRK